MLIQRKKTAWVLGGWGKGVNFSFLPHFFPWILLFLLSAWCWAMWVLYYFSSLMGSLWKKIFFSLIFQMRKETERLTNLPKITQLKNGRTRNQILPWSLQLTAHYFFNKFCLRYRVLKVENVVFECLSFRQPLNNVHEDIFL